jgi:drug/metabolite transporter (DMT)-like permease
LTGNFLAIGASAVYAIYSSYSTTVLSVRKCPLSLYLAMMSILMIAFSFILAPVMHALPPTLTTDWKEGLFGIFATSFGLSLRL